MENIQRKPSSVSKNNFYEWMQLYMEVPEMHREQQTAFPVSSVINVSYTFDVFRL
jgi:hypothetical protein